MTSEEKAALRKRALVVLRQGRCRVVRAVDTDDHRTRRVMAIVHSSRPERSPYAVDGYELDTDQARFSCSCRDGLRSEPCAHAAAVALVTVGAIA